ncbi:MAG: hypothetical protein M1831_006690 [Alyxoria varia]|nr:MAG: hypothetical protein M1831_006690 [Alyxoria varia]
METHASVAPIPPPLPTYVEPRVKLLKTRHGDFDDKAGKILGSTSQDLSSHNGHVPDPEAPRTIYLLAYPIVYSPTNAGRAHLGVFVPELGCSSQGPGTSIDVVGSPFLGYTLQFTRDYDIHDVGSRIKIVELARVDAKYVRDSPKASQIDADAIDELEVVAKRIPAPGKSPNPLDPYAGDTCQAWTRKYAQELVDLGIFPNSALENLERARRMYNSKPKTSDERGIPQTK